MQPENRVSSETALRTPAGQFVFALVYGFSTIQIFRYCNGLP